MRKAIFILILLTVCVPGRAQDRDVQAPVRMVFTADFQQHPFGVDPVWGGWPEGSMARAMTYIDAHRREMGEEHFFLIACGTELQGSYGLYPDDFAGRIADYCGYGVVPDWARIGLFIDSGSGLEQIVQAPGIDIAVVASGREPEVRRIVNAQGDTVTVVNTGNSGKFIGVVDFTSPTDFTAKVVDISGFPVDAEYEEHFRPLTDSLRAFFNEPLAVVNNTLSQEGYLFGPTPYTTLFHRFQMECTGTIMSFFASPLARDSIPARELTFGDIVRRFRYENKLCVVQLTLDEIKQYLEYAYGLRYNTIRRSTDDLLRLTRDRDGLLQTRSAVYNLDEAGGIRYEVDVSKPQGRRVRILSLSDGAPIPESEFHAVALNSHRIESGYLSRACGLSPEQIRERLTWESEADYRLMLREWLTYSQIYSPGEGNWRVIPESFVEKAKEQSGFLFTQ